MKQESFSDMEYSCRKKKTKREEFQDLILGPRILGDSVGISPFWIICSITVFGSLFGFIGMFLGVPLICVIRMFFNDFLQYRKNKIIDK